METLKKRIVWIIIFITVLYFFILRYLEIINAPLNEIVGQCIGFLIIPLFLSLIRGLWDLIRKKFSWNNVKNTFVVFWLFAMVLSILFSSDYGLLSKKDKGIQLKELVRKYASEVNSQRRVYHYKLSSIDDVEIKNAEDLKNIDLINQINRNLTNQKDIEDWNYSHSIVVVKKWVGIFEGYQREHDNIETRKIIEDVKINLNKTLKRADMMKKIQENYFLKYNQVIDFLLTKNNSFTINNNGVFFKDEKDLNNYNILQGDLDKAARLYTDFVTTIKNATTSELTDLNKKFFNIQEIDTLVNMVKYDKYDN